MHGPTNVKYAYIMSLNMYITFPSAYFLGNNFRTD